MTPPAVSGDPTVPEVPPGAFGAALGLWTDPKYVRVCSGGRTFVTDPATTDACVPHTPAPTGYVARAEWAERMSRTHRQVRCPGCGLFKVWVRKETR